MIASALGITGVLVLVVTLAGVPAYALGFSAIATGLLLGQSVRAARELRRWQAVQRGLEAKGDGFDLLR